MVGADAYITTLLRVAVANDSSDGYEAKTVFVDEFLGQKLLLDAFQVLSVTHAGVFADRRVTHVIRDNTLTISIAKLHAEELIGVDAITSKGHDLACFQACRVASSADIIN